MTTADWEPRLAAPSTWWRAVDQDGTVLDILVTFRRDATAATRKDCCVLGAMVPGQSWMPS